MPKVAVYAICKNEARHIERFMASMSEADGIFILDTGSTDGSPDRLRELGAVVKVRQVTPWRFDTARNLALAMVPADYDICVSCDLDEIFSPGWRTALESVWYDGCNRVAYPFFYDDQGGFFYRDLIHARQGFLWAWPIHEALLALAPERRVVCDAIRLWHKPDPGKSRAGYLPQLEAAIRDNPSDTRMLRYLGREYVYRGRWQEAIAVLTRHIQLEHWDAEQAASLRDIARCHWQLGQTEAAERNYLAAIAACPRLREARVELARFYLKAGQWGDAYLHAMQALAIDRPDPRHFNEGFAWGDLPHQIAAYARQQMEKAPE